MATNYVQDGNVIEWTNGGTAVASGAPVVVGKIMGVALEAIANGASGQVQIGGVFNVPKVSAAVIAQGEPLTWDASAGAFDDSAATPASGDVQGGGAVAMAAAGNGVTTLDVLFTAIPGTVT